MGNTQEGTCRKALLFCLFWSSYKTDRDALFLPYLFSQTVFTGVLTRIRMQRRIAGGQLTEWQNGKDRTKERLRCCCSSPKTHHHTYSSLCFCHVYQVREQSCSQYSLCIIPLGDVRQQECSCKHAPGNDRWMTNKMVRTGQRSGRLLRRRSSSHKTHCCLLPLSVSFVKQRLQECLLKHVSAYS